jgi:molybdopterin converting factor small subunit
MLARNQEYVAVGSVAVLQHGDEIAVIPPISGG